MRNVKRIRTKIHNRLFSTLIEITIPNIEVTNPDVGDHIESVTTIVTNSKTTDNNVMIEHQDVAKGGSSASINSSDEDDDELCNVKKPMKGNVIEDDEINYINPTDVNILSQVYITNEIILDTIAAPKNKSLRQLPTRNSLRTSNKDNKDQLHNKEKVQTVDST